MPEMHLRQPEFTYSSCGPFTKNIENVKKISSNRRFKIGSGIQNENISNNQLAEELHKPTIRKFDKRNIHLPFIDNIWCSDLTDMQLISKFNKGFRFLLYVIDIYSKYAWVIPFPLKDKKGITIINAFQKIWEKPNHKPNKIWVDKHSEFYNRSIKSWLEKWYRNVFKT